MYFYVNMHDGINNQFSVNDSPYAAEGVNCPATMTALADKHCPQGPTGYMLEINSHGVPAAICLSPYVGFRQLDQFAALVRRLVKPGGGIEILSCLVARFNGEGLRRYLQPAFSPARSTLARQYGIDNTNLQRQVEQGQKLTTHLKGDQLVKAANDAMNSNIEFLTPANVRLASEPSPKSREYRWYANGPLFCTRLASKTMTTVRAAMISQEENDEASGNAHYSTPFGNWEGHVLDFLPGGGVRYAGFNLPRLIFKTHDQYGDGPLRPS